MKTLIIKIPIILIGITSLNAYAQDVGKSPEAAPSQPTGVPAFANESFEDTRSGKGGYELESVPVGVSLRRAGLDPESEAKFGAVGEEGQRALTITWPGGAEGIWVDLGDVVPAKGISEGTGELRGRISGNGKLIFMLRYGNTGLKEIGRVEAPGDDNWENFQLQFEFPEVQEAVQNFENKNWGIVVSLRGMGKQESIRIDDVIFAEPGPGK